MEFNIKWNLESVEDIERISLYYSFYYESNRVE